MKSSLWLISYWILVHCSDVSWLTSRNYKNNWRLLGRGLNERLTPNVQDILKVAFEILSHKAKASLTRSFCINPGEWPVNCFICVGGRTFRLSSIWIWFRSFKILLIWVSTCKCTNLKYFNSMLHEFIILHKYRNTLS